MAPVDPPAPADAALVADAQRVLATHAKTFRSAAWLLPRDLHDDIAVVYAFCRAVDELADTHADRAGLLEVAAELRGERPARGLVAAVLAVARARGFRPRIAEELVTGALSDLDEVRLPDADALQRYAWRVAGTVGCMTAAMFGATDPDARAFAVDLGVGMQLSNIARDVAEDAALGRVYLPATWLADAGLRPDDVLAGAAPDDALGGVVRRLVDEAERWYASAERGFCFLPLRARCAVGVAAHTYRAIGRAVVAGLPGSLRARTVLSSPARVRHGLSGLAAALAAPLRRAPHDPALHGPALRADLAAAGASSEGAVTGA